MYLLEETVTEIKEIRKKIIEGSITKYSVRFLRSINEEHDDLWKKVSREYANQVENEEKARKHQKSRQTFFLFSVNILKMIEILKIYTDTYSEKIEKIMNITNELRAIKDQDIELKKSSGKKSSARDAAVNELTARMSSKIKINFNGNPATFKTWREQIYLDNFLDTFQNHSLSKYSTVGMGRRIFVKIVSLLPRDKSSYYKIMKLLEFLCFNSYQYFKIILSLFWDVASNLTLSQSEIYEEFHDLLQDLFEFKFEQKYVKETFKRYQENEIRLVVISRIDQDILDNLAVSDNPSTLRDIYNLLKCLNNITKINDQRKLKNSDQNNLLRFETPFIVLDVQLHHQFERISNNIYRGNCNDKRFLIVFNQSSDASYIHRSLVNGEIKNVYVHLTFRDQKIANFIAFVTDDSKMDNSLVIGGFSVGNILNNMFALRH